MRTSTISICAVVAMVASSLWSATYADPLAPGKPAGVRAAQMENKEWLLVGGLGVVAAVVAIASAGGGHQAAPSLPVVVITTSATNP